MKKILFPFLLTCLVACGGKDTRVTPARINAAKHTGNFLEAKKLIDRYIAQDSLNSETIYNLYAQKDTMDRISLDFRRSRESVLEYIKKYYPTVSDDMLAKWEEKKALECMVIDGEKKYFNSAAGNLFRIDKDAREKKLEIDGPAKNNVEEVLKTHLPDAIAALSKSGKTQGTPVKMKVRYTVKLEANAVPEGEVVRCWLPYPREDNRRQANIRLLAVNSDTYTVAPPAYPQRTIYMEKTTEQDKPLEFMLEFSYESAPEWFNLSAEKVKPYNTGSELYKTYTAERSTHVIFTDKIKAASEQIVGSETNPYLKVKKIFDWINDNCPWASAREYSTIPNIPEYVLENRHGDCGQVSLLFITLARYNGIPAKWQSGFMMHPNGLNLHDWAEIYFEGIGWVPVDQSFGGKDFSTDENVKYFFSNGIDAYRWIVNDDYSRPLYPAKTYLRSETVDFQRGELEWRGGNIYFNKWRWNMEVEYL